MEERESLIIFFFHIVFKTKDDLVYIENISTKKVLGTTNAGKVVLEDFVEGKPEQLWKKGELKSEGYFTLGNSLLPKVMTAISSSSLDELEIKGNIDTYIID